MPMDPKARALLDALAARGAPPFRGQAVEAVRAWRERQAEGLPIAVTPVGSIADRTIPGPAGPIPVRIYRPEGRGPFPMLVYFHGGGFTICSVVTHDPICRALGAASGGVVVSVGYRLAPEHQFPAATDDALAATRWAADHAREVDGDPSRLAVAGDSAGGTLATVTALRVRDEGGPRLSGQVLINPVTDSHASPLPSYREFGLGCGLTSDTMDWFVEQYLAHPGDATHPHAFPSWATDLRGLPPALVLTAEFDPLRDEGELYAARLRDAGVPTMLTRYDGMIHAFVGYLGILEAARLAVDEVGAWLRNAWEIESAPRED